MRVILLRHAQTNGNLLGQYIGASDPPLCREGRRRAAGTALRPDVKHVYASDLCRTVQTAQILYPSATISRCAGLNEMNFGLFERKNWEDMKDDAAYRAWVDSYCETACPGGESRADFVRRCVDTFLKILYEEAESNAAEVHFVIHGGTIMALLSELAEPAHPYFDWPSVFCGGYLLEYEKSAANGSAAKPLRLLEKISPEQSR